MKRTILRLTFIVGIVLLFFRCATVPLTGRHQLILFPEDQMVSMSLTSYSSFLKENKLSTDAVNKQRIKNVGAKISKAVEQYLAANGLQDQIANFQWEFNLVASNEPNAWCMPGGKVVFYEGILPYCQNDAGIAVVMGHEIAHAVAHHSNERMSQQALIQYGQAAATEILGHDPNEAVAFWTRMANASTGKQPEFLSTHPADTKRIAKLKEAIPEALKYKKN